MPGKAGGAGGKKQKRGANKGNVGNKRELTLVEDDGEAYAQVTKNFGNLRLECRLTDGTTSLGVIRGTMVRKVWIAVNDVVLVSRREFQDGTVDILHKYNADEVKKLVKDGEIPRNFRGAEDQDRAANANEHFSFEDMDPDLAPEQEVKEVQDRNQVTEYDPLAGLEGDENDEDGDEDADLDDL